MTSRSLHVRLRSRKGWYIASGSVDVDDVTQVALRELVRAPALAGGRFVRLEDGDYLEIDRRIRRTVAALGAVSSVKRGGTELEIHPAAVAALRQLVAPDTGFEVDPAVRAWLERVEQSAGAAAAVPPSLRAELRAYQAEGYRWLARLAELGLGACLADDMGLGKTVQVLALLLARSDDGPALVVAPTSVCANWVREMRRFAPDLTPLEYLGPDRAATLGDLAQRGGGAVVITSYAVLQQDQARLAAVGWSTVVLDEAQFIKNPESLRAQAAFRLSGRVRIAVTGTPVENHYGDLWSIFHFLNPGLLGEWRQFKRRFVLPIERDGSAAPAAELRELVRPYVLRRLKRDVLSELPPVTEVQHTVHLSEADALRYALLRRQVRDRLFTRHGKLGHKLEVLAEITRLRRFCCHPRLVFPDAENESAKIQALIELVEELRENQHRALVFSQYVDFLSLVREQLDERGVSYEYLDGSTPQAQRQARVDAFQNGSASLFLISLKAGGFGVNLTAADYVIHLDPWWNPAVEAQATDRAHRIGQARRVTVYRLVTKDTIEQDIVELHEKKHRLARSLLDGTDGTGVTDGTDVGKLDAADLMRLIGGDVR
ncbi:MAG: DEAD/DEAH box helicase [Polyangiaceae bacterium]